MLRHRLITGTLLAAGIGAVLFVDPRFAPYFPCLFVVAMSGGVLASLEFVALLPTEFRPDRSAVLCGVLGVLAANWYGVVPLPALDPWHATLLAFTGVVLAAFFHEMYHYREGGGQTVRVAMTIFATAYLALLPSFLVKLMWQPNAIAWMLLAIFVPKCCDIGAYFTGRLIGRTPFSPKISPKKTWEGFAGGLVLSSVTAVGIHLVQPLFAFGILEALGFGIVVGTVGVLGDLAESVIKRDFGHKDAAKKLPGFGGLLDVLDSILLAAPVAYLWCVITQR
ncbi:MAG: phosphatidate cytidylyltransferase [Fimbriiglobus sp.]